MPMDKVGRYEFWAEPFHCDFSKRLMMGHLGNHLLNAADFYSHDRGFGMAYLNGINKTWQNLIIIRYIHYIAKVCLSRLYDSVIFF